MHKPQLLPQDTGAAEARSVTALNESVFARPPEYQKAIRELRKQVMSGSVELSPEEGYAPNEGSDVSAYDLLRGYFGNRLDKTSEFDQQTEERILSSRQMTNLLVRHQNAKPTLVKRGAMKSELRTNKHAVPLRDEIRLQRFSMYINLVAGFVKGQNSPASVA
ncbi:MAG: hypothetical protein QG629_170 [Patescibacteria group bacterium]|nr:hypothetical protein [Candidatus Saccharibacteria bacterium]MDQ5963088.1 hypothetical protein [Patescibacteria group bacterium]